MKNIFGFKLNAIALAIMLSSTSVYAANTIIVSKNGSVLSNKPSNSPALNIDGTKIAFVSHSGNLVGDTKLQSNIYLKDTTSNTIVRVSVDNSGIAGERASYGPNINGDGNKVVFYSSSENLVSSDGNGKPDVFLRDLKNNTTQLISVTKSGVQGDAGSIEGVISADGNVVAFSSRATTLTGLSTNAKSQVYVKDLSTGDLEIVSINNSGDAGDQDSFSPSISRDGRYISFASFANNLSSLFNFNQFDIYMYDRQTKKTELITASANLHSGTPSISGDGRYVAFMTLADNLVSGDTVNTIDIVVYDRVTKIFKRAQAPGEAPKGHSFSPKISSDGRFVAFYSSATNLVSGDTNDRDDMFVFDLALNTVERVSVSATGAQSKNNVDQFIALSGNGQAAAFGSPDGIFVSGDTNGVADVFVRQRDPAQSVTPVAKIAVIPTQECTNGSAYIKLDGSTSTDITNKATYTWTGPFGTVTGVTPFVNLGVGVHAVTLKVVNQWGSSSKSISVTVADTKMPTVVAEAPVTREATSSNGAAYVVGFNANDACGLAGTTVSPSPAYYPLGTTDVTVSAVDTVGRTAYASTSVTVTDHTAPVLNVPADRTVEASGIRTSVNIGNATATDYFLKSVSNNAPVDFAIDTTLVTWTAEDTKGNVTSKKQAITVIDSTAPLLTIPADNSFEALAPLTSVDIGTATATDIFPVTISNNAPAQFSVGTTDVVWTATDGKNSSSATQKITLSDSRAPTIVAPANITVEATGIDTSVSLTSATATDAIGVESITSNAPAVFPVGVTTVTWTATDAAGNSSSAAQIVTVEDTVAPVVEAPVNVNVEASGELSVVTFETPDASDVVGVASLTNDAPDTFPVGVTTITWTATDAAGNTGTATQTVTVQDTIAPTIETPVNVSVEATAAESVVVYDEPVASDIVGLTSFTNNAPATFPVGETVITWTALDAAGNSTTATQTVTVVDTTKPSITSPENVEIEATALNSVVLYSAPTASDLVGVTSFTSDAPATFPVGKTTITWTAVDAAGNSNTATQTVTVNDTIAPVIETPVNVEVEATAYSSVVTYPTPATSDIVGVTSFTNNAPTTFPVGTTTITWTAKDAAGNITTSTQTVKVNDTTPAALTIPANMTVEANGNPGTISSLGSVKAIDIVDGDISASVQVTEPANGYVLGANSVNYRITDNAGNVSTGTQTVTMVDTTAPVFASTPASLINVIATSELTAVEIGNATATDIYLKSVTNNHSSNQFPVGETVITWTAEDTSGNKTTFTQTVRVSYQFNGFQSPLKDGGVYKAGRVIPVKINLTYADGSPVSIAQPVISIFKTSNQEVVGDALDISSVSAADNGVTMRYSNNGDYSYNLDTSLLGKGTFQISVLAHAGSNSSVINIALK